MTERHDLDCATVDELAPAYGLGALDRGEARTVDDHLRTCHRPHDEARELIDAASALPATLAPVEPSTGLRARVMTTIAETPQEHRPSREGTAAAPRRAWWQLGPLPAALAAAALAAAVGVGAWGVNLNSQLGERDAAIRAIAGADAIHAATGSAGSGWVIESGDAAMFMAEDLADLSSGELYELWLIGPEGPVAVGTLTDTDGVALVTLEQAVGSATTFAVTIETERVEQPTGDPVVVAALDA